MFGVAASIVVARTVIVWRATASMNVARTSHAALLLPSGKVFVFGGVNTSTAEVYDPATGAWTLAGMGPGGPPSPGSSATVVLLGDGRVLASGGTGGPPFGTPRTAEIYDPAANSWSAVASMMTGRDGHTATLLPSGKVLVAGGSGDSGALNSTEIYDPGANAWTPGPTMASPRGDHTATLMGNGKVIVIGGSNSAAIAGAEIYDPATNAWSPASPMSTARFSHNATLLPTGHILVTGGRGANGFLTSAEIYDPGANGWHAAASLPAAHQAGFAVTLLPDGRVLATGGGFNNSVTNLADVYDPTSDTWTPTASMIAPREGHTTTLLPNGDVLAAGGFSGGGVVSSAELYGPQSVADPPLSPAQPQIAQIRSFRIVPTRFVAASSGPAVRTAVARHPRTGALVSYTDTASAATTITIQRQIEIRRRRGHRCAATARRRPISTCARYVRVGSFKRQDADGANTFRLTGRLNNATLPTGSYRLVAIPRTSAGNGVPAYAAFRVVHR